MLYIFPLLAPAGAVPIHGLNTKCVFLHYWCATIFVSMSERVALTTFFCTPV